MNKGILVTSFGTSYAEARKKSIGLLENMVKEKYGEEYVERAFTSGIVRKIILKNEGIHIPDHEEGLKILKNKGYSEIVTLSTHILDGTEYSKLSNEYGKITKPLLYSEEDYERITNSDEFNDLEGNDALIFMGHGSESEADKSYSILQKKYSEKGKNNIFIGTVEGKISLKDVMEKIKNKNYKKILLKPFMIVAGDHAVNDMASDEKDSWKAVLEREGFEVEVRLKGMGEYSFIREIFMEKLGEIL